MTDKELLKVIKKAKASGATKLNLNYNQLTNLTQLYLGGNQLAALPPEISQLRNLQRFTLWSNNLTGEAEI
jgi:Leucine-rich repeat (LRR) protein